VKIFPRIVSLGHGLTRLRSAAFLKTGLPLVFACATVAFSICATLWGLQNSFNWGSGSKTLSLQILDVSDDPSVKLLDRLTELRASSVRVDSKNFFFPRKSIIFRTQILDFSSTGWLDIRFLRTDNLELKAVSKSGTFVDLALIPTSIGFQATNISFKSGDEFTGEIVGKFVTKEFSRPHLRWLPSAESIQGLSRLDRAGSLMIGAVLAIALFSLILGWLCRDGVFYIFSIWSVLSLRTAAFNGGWDTIWLGLNLSQWQNDLLLRLSLSAYPIVTFLLFGKLFKEYFQGWIKIGFRVILIASSAVFLSSIFQNYESSYGNVRFVSFVGILFCFLAMVSISKVAPSKILYFYATGWTVFFLGILADIGAATGVIPISFQSFLNSQVSVVVSVLIIACALAERMDVDKKNRIVAETREKTALEKFRSTYDGTPIGLCSIDLFGSVLAANPYCRAIFAECGFFDFPISAKDLIGSGNFYQLELSTNVEVCGKNEPLEFKVQSLGDKPQWLAVSMVRATEGYECTIADITSRKLAELRADWLVDHDSVTSLLNRRGFYLRLEDSIKVLSDKKFAYLLAIKIENFRQYTTYFGEFFASELAKVVAVKISQSGVKFDALGRTGENVFFAVLVAESYSDIEDKVEVLSLALNSSMFCVGDRELVVSLSFAAVELDHSKELKTSVAACEIAVGKSANKQVSREKVYSKHDVKLIKIMEELNLISQFRFEFPVSRLFLVAQPIISSSAADRSMSYEILVRMRALDGAVITPDRFIPAVEKSGLMSRLDEWVIESAFIWLVSNPVHLSDLTYMSINLSGASLNDVKFLNTILRLAEKYPAAVKKTCFEITEGVALVNFESTVRFIDTLSALGAKIALDDFGAGYTSFGYLAEIKADFVKIDGSLISGLRSDSSRHEIVKGIVTIAHSLDMQVVAEWVEDVSTIRLLQDMGVNGLQGWALSKPLSLAEISVASKGLDFIQCPDVIQILLSSTSNLAITN
jgi:EAL domain-containing protein (putative c-di-GMP-specific phosphodiesterase class I)/GGDEF domain-containing protein/PAS domain-containing protein